MNRLKLTFVSILLLCMSATLSSCEAIQGIFKAGMWTGILIVAVVVGLIFYFVSRTRK